MKFMQKKPHHHQVTMPCFQYNQFSEDAYQSSVTKLPHVAHIFSGIWDPDRQTLNRTDSRISRIKYNVRHDDCMSPSSIAHNISSYQRASFSSQARRAQSCRVKTKYHPMSRHLSKLRSLSTSGFGQLEELDEINVTVTEKPKTPNQIKSQFNFTGYLRQLIKCRNRCEGVLKPESSSLSRKNVILKNGSNLS